MSGMSDKPSTTEGEANATSRTNEFIEDRYSPAPRELTPTMTARIDVFQDGTSRFIRTMAAR